MLTSGRPVLVVSDSRPILNLGATKMLYASDAYAEGTSTKTRIAVDMLMCSRGKEFIGSPLSTFTNGIEELRRRHAVLNEHELPETKLYAGTPEWGYSKGKCWNKQTTFDGIKSCEHGAAVACFSSCAEPNAKPM